MYLLVTDAYPSDKKLYANMFVHQRVLGYATQNIPIEVFVCVVSAVPESQYTFEEVNVTVGCPSALQHRVEHGDYRKILVHFISDAMMQAFQRASTCAPMIIWIHGHEGMSWMRRWFFFDPNGLLRRDKQRDSSLKNQPQQPTSNGAPQKNLRYYATKLAGQFLHLKKLRRFLLANQDRITLVFVSNWVRRIVESDVGVSLKSTYVIHNPINTEKYAYVTKNAEQRFKLLSIRPFTNRKYANDITVHAIKLLAKKEYFNQLDIRIVGDGPLFDSLIAPLRAYPNLQLEKRFLNQAEMVEQYREYGVFLCPTRMDTQGVSMCEAMASGLVCISSENSAIPEFLPDEAGIRTHSAIEIAKAIDFLVNNPAKYDILSMNSALFIRGKCSHTLISQQESGLILK